LREDAIDEFESIFERASIPVLDVQEVRLERIAVVLKGHPLDGSILRLASELKQRFSASISAHGVDTDKGRAALDAARESGFEASPTAFRSTAELVGQISVGCAQLVLIPEPGDLPESLVDKNDLVRGSAPPILLVRKPIDDAATVFQNVLHSLSGNFRQTQNFAFSFALTAGGGRLFLLHAIDENEVLHVRDALRVSPEMDTSERDGLLEQMMRQGERYLKGVVAASKRSNYEIAYRIAVGNVVETVTAELARGEYGLLVVGQHQAGHSDVSAADYRLMHEVRDVPVLAL